MTIVQEFRNKLERIIRGEDAYIYGDLSPKAVDFLCLIYVPEFDIDSSEELRHWRITKLTKAIHSYVTGIRE